MVEDRGILVEFVGLPASGKTWLARQAGEHFRDEVPDLDSRWTITTSSGVRESRPPLHQLAAQTIAAAIRSPIRSLRCADGLRRSRQLSLMKALRFFGYHHYLDAELTAVRRDGRIHLADQGFLQYLWRIHLTARRDDRGHLDRLVRAWNQALLPDVIVFVEVDHRTRMRRAGERGTPVEEELFDPDHPLIQDDLESYEEITAFIRRNLADNGTPIVQIENREDNVAANLEALTGAIREVIDDDNPSDSSSRPRPARTPPAEEPNRH